MKCPDTILAFTKAFAYEPANESGQPKTYIHEPPTQLPYYLREFNPDDGTCRVSDNDDTVQECVFRGEGTTHKFLTHKGVNSCSLCNSVICNKCAVDQGMQGKICYGCYRSTFTSDVSTMKDIEMMKEARHAKGWKIPANKYWHYTRLNSIKSLLIYKVFKWQI